MHAYKGYIVDYRGENEIIVIHFESPVTLPPDNFSPRDNYTDPEFSVNTMVERAAMSNTYFRKLFVIRFGTTPVKHLAEMRLSHAEKLLSSGTYTVAEAAESSGFSDVKYFTRLVHREFGVPPSMLYKRIEK